MMKRLLKDKKGVALILFLALLLMLTLVGVVAINNSLNNLDISGNRAKSGNLMYAAEAGVEQAFVRIRDYYDHNLPTMSVGSLPADSFVLGSDSVRYHTICDSSAGGCGNWFASARVFASSAFRHISAWSAGHIIISEAWTPGLPNKAAIRQQVAVYHIPVFQFSAIYDTFALEIFPEAAYAAGCNLNGRIHTNRNLYLATRTTATLNLQNNVTARDSIRRAPLFAGTWPLDWALTQATCTNGPNSIMIRPFSGNLQSMCMGRNVLDHTYSRWIDSSLARWGGTVEDSAHKISDLYLKMVMPDNTPPHRLIERRGVYPTSFDELADLRIYTDTTDIAAPMGSSDTALFDDGTGNYVEAVAVQRLVAGFVADSTYDYREGRRVSAITLNIRRLTGTQLWPRNGIIYISRKGTNPNTTIYGVLITEAATLPAPLTIVSDRPVYIVGNFNTITPQFAAIIADAVTILSGDVCDTLLNPACTPRPPSQWTVATPLAARRPLANHIINACIMTGNRPTTTTPSRYSGGLWNLARLLEDWTGRNLTIFGSMACFWRSQIADTAYRFPGEYYRTPTDLTLTFNTILSTGGTQMPPTTFLPPGTPVLNLVMKTKRQVYAP